MLTIENRMDALFLYLSSCYVLRHYSRFYSEIIRSLAGCGLASDLPLRNTGFASWYWRRALIQNATNDQSIGTLSVRFREATASVLGALGRLCISVLINNVRYIMHAAERDLNIASDAIDVMANETTFTGFERAWTDFLYRLERAWEISKRHAEKSGPAGQKWLSAYANFRRKDSLISYLKHARDAETHAVAPTLDRDLRFSFRDSSGRPFRVDAVEIEISNGTLTIDVKTPENHLNWRGEVLPGDPKLIRFKTRNTWFNPPYEHLGNPIRDIHPVAGAMLGLAFYRSAVASLLRETAPKEPPTPLNN